MGTRRFKKGDPKNLSLKRKLRQAMTPAENKLWLQLRLKQVRNLKFRRQHGIGPYIVDFYCSEKGLVIEVDGDVHAQSQQIEKDRQREDYLKGLGLEVIRYRNEEVLTNLENVMEDLYQRVCLGSNRGSNSGSTLPDPPLQREGGGR